MIRDVTSNVTSSGISNVLRADPLPSAANPFWALLNTLPVGAVLFDPHNDGFIQFNDAACQQLGYTRVQFAQLGVGDVDLLRTSAEIQAERKKLQPDSPPQKFRTKQRAADGAVRDVEVLIQSIILDQRTFGLAIWHDVTDHTQALALLREREAELARVQRIGKVGGFSVDLANGFTKYRSPEYSNIHEMPANSVTETHDAWMRRLHPDDRERAHNVFLEAVLGPGRDYASEYRVSTAQGDTRWISSIGEIERDGQGRPMRMVGAHIDITALKHAETLLAQHAQSLEEADRRKDQFLAMLGHELRNPMAALLSASNLLKRTTAQLPDDVVHAHQIIERHLDQLGVIVDDLLDVARIQSGKVILRQEIVDLATTVHAALEQVADLTAQNSQRCTVTLSVIPVFVAGDSARLIQVISNLLHNAAKYTDTGGTIGVTVSADTQEVSLTIQDSGIGIAPELLPHVFDLFVQSRGAIDPANGGLGIGLTLAKWVVQQHGGRITADSAGLGLGSTFTVHLPRANPPQVAQVNSSVASSPTSASGRILIVDDNVDAAESIATLLSLDGHEVSVLHSGDEVLRHTLSFRPNIVLLDLGLPGQDGFQVARQLRACPQLQELVLIAITGYGDENDRRKTRDYGFDHHFVKPIAYPQLQALICASIV